MEFNATFLVSFVSFIVFVVLMNQILYRPLDKIVRERKQFVDGNYNDANTANQKASALIKDRADRISKAGSDARKTMVEITDTAKNEKAQVCAEAKNVANEEVKAKKEELANTSRQVSEELKGHVVSIAETISSKILGENVNISNADSEAINKIMQEGYN